jgi:hypothetical protein
MRPLAKFIIWIALVLLLPLPVAAQGAAGEKPEPPGQGLYNPQTVETVSGLVLAISYGAAGEGLPAPVYLTLKTDQGKLTVLAGPRRFLERQPLQIAALDRIQVTGSRVEVAGKPALIAAEIRKGEQVIRLRNDQGLPLWGRGRK